MTDPHPPASRAGTAPAVEVNRPLEGLRAVAALLVLFTHLASSASGNRYGYARYTGRFDVGVTIFFVISGYLLYLPFARALTGLRSQPNLRRYLRRRVLRIFPAYWVVMLVSAFIYERAMPMDASELARYLTLTHIYTPSTFDNPVPPAWSLSTEVAFYAFLPLFAWAISRLPGRGEHQRVRNQWLGLGAMVLVAFAFRAWLVSLDVPAPGQPATGPMVEPLTVVSLKAWIFNHLDTFAVGMGLALFQVNRERRTEVTERGAGEAAATWSPAAGRTVSVVGVAVAVAAFLAVSSEWVGLSVQQLLYSPTQEWGRHLLYTVVGGGLVVAAVAGVRGRWFGTQLLGSPPMRFLGRISYGIYLTQILVIGIYLSRRPQDEFGIPIWQMTVFVLPVVVGLSWLLFRFVERPAMSLRNRRLPSFAAGLWGIGGAALLWRLVSLLHITTVNPDGGDPFYYHIQAGLLSAGRGFSEPFRWTTEGILEPTAIHPPLYSMYLSISSFLGADSYLAHKTLSVVAGVASVVVIGLIARRLAGEWAGWIAAAIAGFYPPFWIVDGILWAVGLFTLLIGLTVLAALHYRDRPGRWPAVGLGLAVSGAVLTRGEALLLAPLLIAPLVLLGPRPLAELRTWWRRRRVAGADADAVAGADADADDGEAPPWRERWVRLGLAAVAVALPIVPWVARNMTAFEEPVTLSSNSDEVFFYANCPDSYYGELVGYWSFTCQERVREVEQEPREESVRVKYWRDKGFDYALANKRRWPVVVAARVARVFEVYRPGQAAQLLAIEGRPLGWTKLGQVMWWAMLPLAAVGAWALRRRGVWTWPLWSQVVMVMTITVLVYGHVRFRTPMDLAVIVFAAAALSMGLRRWAPAVLAPGPAAWVLGREHDAPDAPDAPDAVGGGRLARLGAGLAEGWRSGPLARWRSGPGAWWAGHPRWRTGVGVAIIALAVLAPLRELFRRQGVPMEEGFMLVFPERVLEGDVPNVDFLHLYGPGSLWALAAWYKMAGISVTAERVFGLGQLLGIVGFVAALARAWGRRIMVAAGLSSVIIAFTAIGLVAMAWNGGLALLLGGVVALRHALAPPPLAMPPKAIPPPSRLGRLVTRRRALIASGVLFGAALLFRPDLIAAVGLVVAVAAWLIVRILRAGTAATPSAPPAHDQPFDRRTLLAAGGAFAGVSALMLVQVAIAGPGNAVRGMVIEPVFKLRDGRALPVPPSWGSIDGFTQRVAMLKPPSWPLPMPTPSQQVFLWFALLLGSTALAMVAAVAVGRRSGWSATSLSSDPGRLTTLLVAPLTLGILPQGLQRADTTHLAWVGCVVIPLLPGLVFQLTRDGVARPWRGRWAGLLGAAGLALLVVVAPIYTVRPYLERISESAQAGPEGWTVRAGDRSFPLGGEPLTTAAQALAADLEAMSEPGQRLFVGPSDLSKTPYSDAYWYHVFGDLVPATRYIEMDPGIADAPGSGLAEDLASADWVILSHTWDGWDEANDSGEPGSTVPNDVLVADFCRYRLYGDSFELWRHRPADGVCADPEEPTPVRFPPPRNGTG
ncbi:MAG: acyltransferase [Microthrixaceae bacterium]